MVIQLHKIMMTRKVCFVEIGELALIAGRLIRGAKEQKEVANKQVSD